MDREEKKVSVIIPAYNCRNTLAQAIRSALIQPDTAEVIVCNDASPEPLNEVYREFQSDPRVV